MKTKVKNVKREKRQKQQDQNILQDLEDSLQIKRVNVGGKYRTQVTRKGSKVQKGKRVKGLPPQKIVRAKSKVLINQPWNRKKNNAYWKQEAINNEVNKQKLRYVTHIRWSYLGQYLSKGQNSPVMFNGRSAAVLEGKVKFSSMYRYAFPPAKRNEIQFVLNEIKGFRKVGRDTLLTPGTYRMSDNSGQYTVQDKLSSQKGKAKSIIKKKFIPFPQK